LCFNVVQKKKMSRNAKPKIMIVDDDPCTLESLKTILNKDGYDVVLASSAREALNLLKNEAIKNETLDLKILDITLQDTDGPTLSRLIKENSEQSNVKIIYLTIMKSTR